MELLKLLASLITYFGIINTNISLLLHLTTSTPVENTIRISNAGYTSCIGSIFLRCVAYRTTAAMTLWNIYAKAY